jgi:hypothetical protein
MVLCLPDANALIQALRKGTAAHPASTMASLKHWPGGMNEFGGGGLAIANDAIGIF